MPGQTQIEFVRLASGNTFAYNAAPATINALNPLIAVNPDLINRRIYADVRQPSGFTRIVTFTLTFKLAGQSVGSITQRVLDASASAWGASQQYYGLGATADPGSAGSAWTGHRVPHSMSCIVTDVSGGDTIREVVPIELAAKFDEISVSVSEWSTPTTSNGWIILACLSTFHRFN